MITIDIKDQRTRPAKRLPISKRRVDFLQGSSTDPAIVAEMHRRAKGKRVLVLLDSLHSKEHVATELAAYALLAPVGSYVIVQDTTTGPLPAIDEFWRRTLLRRRPGPRALSPEYHHGARVLEAREALTSLISIVRARV